LAFEGVLASVGTARHFTVARWLSFGLSSLRVGPGLEVRETLRRYSCMPKPSHEIGLVAGGRRRRLVATILANEGFAVTCFDCVQAISDVDDCDRPSAIVVWVEDTTSSLSSLIERLAKRFAGSPVVVACASIQRWEVRAALAAGAAGVVVHDDLDSSLGPCLRAVRVGQLCVPRGHWRQIEPPVLSTREKQILGLVVMGYMNSQIAEQLFLAESTVKSHLSSAFGKLGVRSRNEAVDLIINPERGLGMGILGLGGEPLATAQTAAR
jgi:DNA-binding NarL/FixJ family response regulator